MNEKTKGLMIIITMLILCLVFPVSMLYILSHHDTFITSFIYSLFPLITSCSFVLILIIFEKNKFYWYESFKDKIKKNFTCWFFLFLYYFLLILILTSFSVYLFDLFITDKILEYNPQLLIYTIPSFFGWILFFIRTIDLIPILINKLKKKKLIEDKLKNFPILHELMSLDNMIDNIKKIKITLFDFSMAMVIFVAIGLSIFNKNILTILPKPLISRIILSCIGVAFILSIIDGIIHSLTAKDKVNPNFLEKTRKKEDCLEKHPVFKKLLIIFSILFIITSLFYFIWDTHNLNKQPMINESIKIPAYTISFYLNKTSVGEFIPPEKIIILNDEFLEYYTKTIKIKDKLFPLSNKILSLIEYGSLKYNVSELYLNKKIEPKNINGTLSRRNQTKYKEPDWYYFTTEYDDCIFLVLNEHNYSNITSFAFNPQPYSPSTQYATKIFYTKKYNNSLLIRIDISGDRISQYTTISIFTKDKNMAQEIKERIENINENVYVKLLNQTYSEKEVFKIKAK